LFRHPAVTAKALASLDQLSGGRTFAGMGSGWTQREFDQSGIAFPAIAPRLRMLDEALTCMRALWTEPEASFAGEFYTLTHAVSWPKPVQKPYPPILLGGGGRGLLRVAAKHADVINIISDSGKPGYISLEQVAKLTDESFRSKVEFVRREAAAHGRNGAEIRISNVLFSVIVTESPEATQRMAEAVAPMFQTTAELLQQSPMALLGTPEQLAAELKRRARAWHVDQFIFSNTPADVARRLAEEVLPHVR
jgi:alkanesulfonate monooxygenase SsuD/methylene tetrahydromethanopterin reductase-like flavin-dependent oxidoreductase (luciferase family)